MVISVILIIPIIVKGTLAHVPIEVLLNKNVYLMGEPVIISIINKGFEDIYFPSPMPYKVVDVKNNITIYTPITTQIIYVLEKRMTLILVWNQTDNKGGQVPPGKYMVVVEYIGGKAHSEIFTIIKREDKTVNTQFYESISIYLIIIIIILFAVILTLKFIK